MDTVGLKELLHEAEVAAAEAWSSEVEEPGGTPLLDFDTILDRLAQMGLIALQHEQAWLWSRVIESLVSVYQLGVPQEPNSAGPPSPMWLARVTQRVLLLGGLARKAEHYGFLRELVLQWPIGGSEDALWMRYTVSMASRSGVSEVFKGKSLIGPASEIVREKPTFYLQFSSNLDSVVDEMCRFDYLACVVSMAATKSAFSCYPNFGAYYSQRTMPIVHDLIRHGAARSAIPEVDDGFLAEIIRKLGRLAGRAFFEISGFDGYDTEVERFLETTQPTERILDAY